MGKLWLSSDHHFGEDKCRVLRFRPFHSVEAMNERMVELWNHHVAPDDVVIHLGDFATTEEDVERYAPRLNGEIELLMGNHDHRMPIELLEEHFLRVYEGPKYLHPGNYWEDPEDENSLWVCHYPVQKNLTFFTVCGHVHELWKLSRRTLNVSVDVWQFAPVPIEIVLEYRKRERDNRYDANVYPDADLRFQWDVTKGSGRWDGEPTLGAIKGNVLEAGQSQWLGEELE